MKKQISITVDKKLVEKTGKLVEEGGFRNKLHVFEYALKNLIKSRRGK